MHAAAPQTHGLPEALLLLLVLWHCHLHASHFADLTASPHDALLEAG